MNAEEFTDTLRKLRSYERFVSSMSNQMIHFVTSAAYLLSNIEDHPYSECFSTNNQDAVTEFCKTIALKMGELNEWADSASSMLPAPFDYIAENTFTMGVDDNLVERAVTSKTQTLSAFYDQLGDEEIHRRRDDEGKWIEDKS